MTRPSHGRKGRGTSADGAGRARARREHALAAAQGMVASAPTTRAVGLVQLPGGKDRTPRSHWPRVQARHPDARWATLKRMSRGPLKEECTGVVEIRIPKILISHDLDFGGNARGLGK